MSTDLCLQRLRKEDYFCALNWLKFLETNYAQSGEKLDADTLMLLGIYELMMNGFTLRDSAYIERMYALVNHPLLFKLPGQFSYASTFLISAAVQCQVYLENDLISFYSNKPSDYSIVAWMSRDNGVLNTIANNKLNTAIMRQFEENMSQIQDDKLLFYKTLCTEYLLRFNYDEDKEIPDQSGAIRMGVIATLNACLKAEDVWTETLNARVEDYAQQILRLKPDEWEMHYLNQLTPKPVTRTRYTLSKEKLRFFVIKMIENVAPVITPEDTSPTAIVIKP